MLARWLGYPSSPLPPLPLLWLIPDPSPFLPLTSAFCRCQGFDMEGSYCGYLKAHAGRGKTVYTEAFSHFCKIGGTGSCEGASGGHAGCGMRPACSALLPTARNGLLQGQTCWQHFGHKSLSFAVWVCR